jgi:DNA-directed RNA polymerase specialized sigma24 family protein
VNELFCEYASNPARNLEVQIELWTYCFVRRYLTTRLARDGSAGGADLDALLDTVYLRIHRGRPRVRERYASWVCVVCKNSYLNYVRDRHPASLLIGTDVDEAAEGRLVGGLPDVPDQTEFGLVLDAVDAAIRRLPDYLQQVTRLRLLEDLDYDEIAVIVDRPVAIVRSYAHKAIVRLRSDREVCHMLGRPVSDGEVMPEP